MIKPFERLVGMTTNLVVQNLTTGFRFYIQCYSVNCLQPLTAETKTKLCDFRTEINIQSPKPETRDILGQYLCVYWRYECSNQRRANKTRLDFKSRWEEGQGDASCKDKQAEGRRLRKERGTKNNPFSDSSVTATTRRPFCFCSDSKTHHQVCQFRYLTA